MDLAAMGEVNDDLIETLNSASNGLRFALSMQDEASLDLAYEAFIETLDLIGNRCPSLASKVADLKQLSVH